VNAAALIVRELRAESRRAANYWLRVLAATAMILAFVSVMLSEQVSLSRVGMELFMGLNRTLLFAFWVLVPLMTADCVSREKREGTLDRNPIAWLQEYSWTARLTKISWDRFGPGKLLKKLSDQAESAGARVNRPAANKACRLRRRDHSAAQL
jgi:hypothetical protein